MRGKVCFSRSDNSMRRITPASAGKSGICFFGFVCFEDHPRECGEKNPHIVLTDCLSGSPPRVRGKVAFNPTIRTHLRITPASAGKRCYAIHLRYICEDHPRECGEKERKRRFKQLFLGSPPRVRGKEGKFDGKDVIPRITPASAGKSIHYRK